MGQLFGGEPGEDDHGQVNQRRAERRHGEPPVGVEGRGAKGRRSHQRQEGKDPPGEGDGSLEQLGLITPTRRKQPAELGGQGDAQDRHHRQHGQPQAADRLEKVAGGVIALPLTSLGQDGYHRAGNGPLGQQLPQGVGNGEGHEEGIRIAAPEQRSQHHVPGQTEQAGQERPGGHDRGAHRQPAALRGAALRRRRFRSHTAVRAIRAIRAVRAVPCPRSHDRGGSRGSVAPGPGECPGAWARAGTRSTPALFVRGSVRSRMGRRSSDSSARTWQY